MIFVVPFVSCVFSQDDNSEHSVPDDAAQAESMKLIEEVYGNEFAKAKTSVEKQALAKKMLVTAGQTKDDVASQFVLLKLAKGFATNTGDGPLAFQAIDAMAAKFQVDVAELVKVLESVKVARVTLENAPDDPQANLVMGKHICFVEGDWDTGRPMLMFGTDDALKALAKQELESSASFAEQFKLGDGWWDCPLMWSHYAHEHRGICVEYDSKSAEFKNLAKVHYNRARSIKISELAAWKLNGCEIARTSVFDTFFLSKAPQWKYEKEWRDISDIQFALDLIFVYVSGTLSPWRH